VVPAERWGPYGVPTIMLGNQLEACRGTRARDCPVAGHPCLSGVPPAAVVAAVRQLITSDRPEAGGPAQVQSAANISNAVSNTRGAA
jgi:lipopolysaccharide heptosyltransferase III